MPAELHETSLIALLAVGFVLALLFGLGASILNVPRERAKALWGRDAQVNPEGT